MRKFFSKYIRLQSRCNHLFDIDEVVNLEVDPKCTKCGEKLSVLKQKGGN